MPACMQWSHYVPRQAKHVFLILFDPTKFGWYMGLCMQAHGCMHASLHTWVDLCAQKDTACYHDSIDTLISLIPSNLAEICAFAHKHIGCMRASLRAQVDLCAQKDLACYPDSIDTLISLIWSNLAEIWACACKHIGCMHANLRACIDLCPQKDPACYPDSIDTLILRITCRIFQST